MAKATKPIKVKPAKVKPADKTKKKPGAKDKALKKKTALPLPGGMKVKPAKLPKRIRKAEARVLQPLSLSPSGPMPRSWIGCGIRLNSAGLPGISRHPIRPG